MPVSLKYRVVNATVAPQQREIVVEDQAGLFTVNRKLVDLVAVEHAGGTISLDLPPDTDGFDPGAEYIASFAAAPVKKGG